VSLALFGAYVTRAKIDLVHSSILDPKVFSGEPGPELGGPGLRAWGRGWAWQGRSSGRVAHS
jgi:hypothetical protein